MACKAKVVVSPTFRPVRERCSLKAAVTAGSEMDVPTHKIEAIMTHCYEKEVREVARLYFDNRKGCMASFAASTTLRR